MQGCPHKQLSWEPFLLLPYWKPASTSLVCLRRFFCFSSFRIFQAVYGIYEQRYNCLLFVLCYGLAKKTTTSLLLLHRGWGSRISWDASKPPSRKGTECKGASVFSFLSLKYYANAVATVGCRPAVEAERWPKLIQQRARSMRPPSEASGQAANSIQPKLATVGCRPAMEAVRVADARKTSGFTLVYPSLAREEVPLCKKR